MAASAGLLGGDVGDAVVAVVAVGIDAGAAADAAGDG